MKPGGKGNGLPPGWEHATIADLFDQRLGKMLDASKNVGQLRPYLRNANVRWLGFDLADVKQMRVEEHELKDVSVRAGDLVVCEGGEPGRAAVWRSPNESFVIQKACHRLRPYTGVDPGFYAYWFATESGSGRLGRAFTGSTIKHLTGVRLRALPIPLPPTGEQRRIVAEIEKQFTRLDAAVGALEAVQAKLKRARASVLKAAVEGRLVPTEAELARGEGRSYERASVLLERILEERRRRSPKGKKYEAPVEPEPAGLSDLPSGWTSATVDQVSSALRYGTSAKCTVEDTGVPVLRMGNIADGRLDFSDLKYLPSDHDEFPDQLLSVGELLFNRTNSAELVGKCAVFDGFARPCACASYLIRVALFPGLQPHYLAYCINSPRGRSWIREVASQQVGQANVNGSKLAAHAFPLPPTAEQIRIVAEVDRRLSVLNALEHTVEQNLARCNRLRQSILKRAFEGKLVPQDPADEPASELLARIRSQRSAEATA